MYHLLIKSKPQKGTYSYIYIAAVLLAFHYYFITYIVGRENVGFLYAISSIINIVIFLKVAEIIRKYSTYKFLIFLSLLEIICLLILGLLDTPSIIIGAFILHHSFNPVILACLDVYLEDRSDVKNIGKIRGLFLTIISLAAVISPLAIGSLVTDGNFSYAYLFSGFFMLLFVSFIVLNFKNIPSGQFKRIKIFSELKEFFRNKSIRKVGICAVILQFFYSWMIIYVPLYLREVMNFSWKEIALLISVSLVPFILFEIPIGRLVDDKSNEGKVIGYGFFLAAISILIFPLLQENSFFLWAIMLFLARAGASIIEPSSESYFFKHSKGKDELIGIYRIAGPFAFIIGPMFGSLLLFFYDFKYLFPILSCILLVGVIISLRLKNNINHSV